MDFFSPPLDCCLLLPNVAYFCLIVPIFALDFSHQPLDFLNNICTGPSGAPDTPGKVKTRQTAQQLFDTQSALQAEQDRDEPADNEVR